MYRSRKSTLTPALGDVKDSRRQFEQTASDSDHPSFYVSECDGVKKASERHAFGPLQNNSGGSAREYDTWGRHVLQSSSKLPRILHSLLVVIGVQPYFAERTDCRQR